MYSSPKKHPVTIRAATLLDAEAIAKVHVETWRTTYRGIVPDDFLAHLSYAQREQFWYQILTDHGSRTVVYVAVDESVQVVGFASGGAERSGDPIYTGELYAIYLLASHQGHGIGRQLVISFVNRLMQDGLTALLVWVLAENPSRRFYERLGGRPVYEKTVITGGVPLLEIGYGWQDVQTLIQPSERPRLPQEVCGSPMQDSVGPRNSPCETTRQKEPK